MGIDGKRALRILFGFIFASLAGYTAWASTQQPVWEWGGLTRRCPSMSCGNSAGSRPMRPRPPC